MISTVSLRKEKESLEIQIQNKCSVFVKIILLLILIPCALLPISGIALAAGFGELNFGILLGAGVFYAIFFYPLLKITIWQFYGQEIFSIHKDKVTYEACFKFLKNQSDEMTIDRLEILFSDRKLEKGERTGTLVLLNEENKLKSALKINEADYQQILKKHEILKEETV